MRAYGEAFQPDAEYLTFDTVLHHGLLLLEDFVERLFQGIAVQGMVYAHVLAAVVNPQIHDTGVVLCFAHGVGNVAATLGVLHPELADRLVWVGQREVAALGVRERRGVEVEQSVVLLCPVNPALEMLYADLIAVNNLTLEVAVNLMKVQAVCSGDQALGLKDIRT